MEVKEREKEEEEKEVSVPIEGCCAVVASFLVVRGKCRGKVRR